VGMMNLPTLGYHLLDRFLDRNIAVELEVIKSE
jgi:hypothetical protein